MVYFRDLAEIKWPSILNEKDFWVWGVSDQYCTHCSTPFFLLSSKSDAITSSDLRIVCFSGGHCQDSTELQPDILRLILSRGRLTLESLGDFSQAADWLSDTVRVETSASTSIQLVDLSSTPVPSGYKSVGWIKPSEAQAVLAAQASSANQNLSDFGGSSKVSVRYHESASNEATKYHSQFELVRTNKSFWIRPEEALAILEAFEMKKPIGFQHLHFGNGGLVEFYDVSHPAAARFRSQTRLLRKSR